MSFINFSNDTLELFLRNDNGWLRRKLFLNAKNQIRIQNRENNWKVKLSIPMADIQPALDFMSLFS